MERKRVCATYLAGIIALSLCMGFLDKYTNKLSITSFKFDIKHNPQLRSDITGKVNGSEISVVVPDDLDVSSLVATYEHNGVALRINHKDMNGLKQNYSTDVNCTLFGKYSHVDYTVHVIKESNVGKEITQFTLTDTSNNKLKNDIQCVIKKNVIMAYLPPDINDYNFIAEFKTTGEKVLVDGTELISAKSILDYSKTQRFIVIGKDGGKSEYKVNLERINTGLPAINIQVDNSNLPIRKEYDTQGIFSMNNDFPYTAAMQNYSVNISIRGHSTAAEPKKGYNLVFENEVELLGLKKSKNYALIANYIDKTMLRHHIAYELSQIIFGKTEYSPSGRYVDLFLNNNYQGCYFLSETVEVSEEKVQVYPSNNPQTGFNGFMIVGEFRDKDKKFFSTSRGVSFKIEYPKNNLYTEDTASYVQRVENEIYSHTNLKDIDINLDSFVNWYLVNEIMKNMDARDMMSVYMYGGVDGKLHIGPVWDFDLSSGNVDDYSSPEAEGFWIKNNPWMAELFKNSDFSNLVKKRWQEIRPEMDKLTPYINSREREIEKSVQCNYQYWDISDNSMWGSSKRYLTYQESVDDLVKWLNDRIRWLDSQWNEG